MSIELKTASGGSVTLVPEDGVSNVTATVKHESGVLASEFDAGVGRTWQDVTASRSLGVTYTNNTGRDIGVSVTIGSGSVGGTAVVDYYLNGSRTGISYAQVSGLTAHCLLNFIVPNGTTYQINQNVGTGGIILWWELR